MSCRLAETPRRDAAVRNFSEKFTGDYGESIQADCMNANLLSIYATGQTLELVEKCIHGYLQESGT